MPRLNIVAAGLQEVRWLDLGETDAGKYMLLWSGLSLLHVQGVAIALHHRVAASLVTWKPLGPQLIYARLRHTCGFVSVVCCYAITEIADDTDCVQHELQRISKHGVTVVLGDFNATVGANRLASGVSWDRTLLERRMTTA
ncbi:uncharacterized protein LOC110983933 [Acanthaster planci]|uniref:Uncharacterized protein LOC110983933 n=1 Tax=Acanthaster planci TaxID=133434 RepID=A0A8B7Z7N2_ACAPL|nr:uncharacterized protein LOC110983933 [Acanthaster planci]